MLLAVLSCDHMLRVDDDDQSSTSEFCPGCAMWVGVKEYVERSWPDE